ncbi:DnaT-like ssDNA-binding protein [Phenylobacterium sp. SCN 70-31]|uniref:DnaT-like ssDNA-binding protein n=1 Tax=Phenylobacterium sp. SCN 70-31 TaxID=1660129 RepID=UPI0025DB7DCC|nr:DnaT-like ssDNA-binding protein [Phenylobacterium sp. SCN 70-31]
MEFVVEDGTGLANATSYATVDEANTYFANLNNADWDYSNTEVQAYLNQATYQVDLTYASSFLGSKLTAEQALQFPRTPFTANDGFDRTGVPVEVKRATFEVAFLISKGGALVTNPDRADQLKRQTQIVGDLELTNEYFNPMSTTQTATVGLVIAPVLRPGSGSGGIRNMRVVRA